MPVSFLRTTVILTMLTISPVVLFSSSLCPGGRCGLFPAQSSSAPALDFRSEIAAPHPAMVRILVETGAFQNYGTGTWIQLNPSQKAILTCAHLFGTTQPENIVVYFPNQSPLSAQLQAIDQEWDVALLSADAGDDSIHFPEPVHLTQNPPKPGDYLRFSGYGPTGTCLWNLGTLRGYCRLPRVTGCSTMVLNGKARMGDSGGPIFTLDDQLAGVLWGTDDHCVYGTWAGKIRQIFDEEFQNTVPESSGFQSRFRPFRKPREKTAPACEPEPKPSKPPKYTSPFLFLLLLFFLVWFLPAGFGWWWVKKHGGKTA